ncbi:MAG: protein kinase [Candidatus Pacebacteria bacterium]|nr:protein kinase [Candidatus Paceibacterota bacterium]
MRGYAKCDPYRYILKIKGSRPKLKAIKGWCREILKGLKYLHEQTPPIVHRDIKCDNIFINTNIGGIKIGDLGLATSLKKEYAESMVGTAEYMAPELYEEKYTTKVDVYAFGMCLLEMITLEPPYKECSNLGIIYQRVINGIPPESLNAIEDKEVKDLIIWCLSKADKRPTVQQLLAHPYIALPLSRDNRFFADQDNPMNNREITLRSRETSPRKVDSVKPKPPEEKKQPESPAKKRSEGVLSAREIGGTEKAPLERLGSAKKRTRKQQFVPVEVEEKKARLCDQRYAEQRDLFRRITKKNSSTRNPPDPTTGLTSAMARSVSTLDECKSDPRATGEKCQCDVKEPIEDENPRMNRSMIVLKKEFFRPRSDSKGEIVNLKMLVDAKDNEVLQLKFDYNLESDTPESVAQEMVKALALDTTDTPKIVQAIKEELSPDSRV